MNKISAEQTYYRVRNKPIKSGYIAEVGPFAFAVENCITSFMNGTTKKAWPTRENLVRCVGCDKDTVTKSVKLLVAKGHLLVKRGRKRNGKFGSNVYYPGPKSPFFWRETMTEENVLLKSSYLSQKKALSGFSNQDVLTSSGQNVNKINKDIRLTNKTSTNFIKNHETKKHYNYLVDNTERHRAKVEEAEKRTASKEKVAQTLREVRKKLYP
jgi:predicted transcriptional regulator